MQSTPDYTKYSLEELHDVARRINKELYPERYALLLEQIERKQQEPVEEQELPEQTVQKRKSILRIVAAVQVVSGVGGLLALVFLFPVIRFGPMGGESLFGIVPVFSIAAGIMLWRGHPRGELLSVWLQAIQVPIIKTAFFTYFLSSGLRFIWTRGWLQADGSIALVIGVNFIAVALLWALLLNRKR